MELSSFLLTSQIRQETDADGSKTAVLTKPMTVIRAKELPCSVSFGITFAVRDVDPTVKHTVTLSMRNEGGMEHIIARGNTASARKKIEGLSDIYQGFVVTVEVRSCPLESAGIYRLVIDVDGERFERELPVYVG